MLLKKCKISLELEKTHNIGKDNKISILNNENKSDNFILLFNRSRDINIDFCDKNIIKKEKNRKEINFYIIK